MLLTVNMNRSTRSESVNVVVVVSAQVRQIISETTLREQIDTHLTGTAREFLAAFAGGDSEYVDEIAAIEIVVN